MLVALIGFFGFTVSVNPEELGVVLRFGKFVRLLPPGLNFRWPYPIEVVELPKVTRVNRIEIGMRGSAESRDTSSAIRDVPEESLMLTGDENIVDVDFVVFWQISDAPNFLFNIQNPEGTVKDVAESAMREIVGQSDIEPILTEARAKTEAEVQALMQKTLDSYGAGVQVTQVQLQKVDPPAQVIDAFRDVQAARADQERLQNEAQAYANRIIPEAKGEAERILQAAQGYRDKVIAMAKGEADRFINIYEQYKLAPDVTRKRMFLETMERVLADTDKVIVDGKAGSGVVPYLPLVGILQEAAGGSGGPAMNRTALTFILILLGTRRGRRLSDAVHRQPDAAGARARIRQAEARHHRAGAALQDPLHPECRVLRQAHPRHRHRLARGDRLRQEAARGRCLRPLPDHRSACCSSRAWRDERIANSRALARCSKPRSGACWAARALPTVVRDKREELMRTILSQVNQEAKPFGVKIVDVRIKRVDLPEANMQAIYRRMQTERQREAAEFRAEGEGAVAAHPRHGRPRGHRDQGRCHRRIRNGSAATAMPSENRIYAEAYSQDPDFFAFYRSMQAYETR